MSTNNYWRRLSERRFSRRKALIGAAGISAAAVSLAACGGGNDGEVTPGGSDTPSAQETPRPGGTVKLGRSVDPGQIDAEQTLAGYWVAASFNGYLHGVNPDDTVIDFHVAESLEQPDDLTYIWKLRPDVKFHNVPPVNGRGVTAADVTYSFRRRAEDPQSALDKLFMKTYCAEYGDTDPLTFRLVTSEPHAPTLNEVVTSGYAIQPQEAVEAGNMATEPIGCGPWMIDKFVRGERVVMKKNPDYYKPGLPYLDVIEYPIIFEDATLIQALLTGQHDSTNAIIGKLMRDQLSNEDNLQWVPYHNLYPRIIVAKVDVPPFNDSRVLEALDLAIDREDLFEKVVFGDGTYCGPLPADLTYWALPQEELRDFFKRDVEKAKQLLAAAGYADGLEVEVIVPTMGDVPKYTVVVTDQVAEAGFKFKLQMKELGVWITQHLWAKNFTLTFYQNLPYTDPDRYLGAWSTAGSGGFNFSNYSNPEMDEWVTRTRRELDPEARRELVLEAQRAMLRQHGPLLPLPLPRTLIPFSSRMRGMNNRVCGTVGPSCYFEEWWVTQ